LHGGAAAPGPGSQLIDTSEGLLVSLRPRTQIRSGLVRPTGIFVE
jgi:hypothetical protein